MSETTCHHGFLPGDTCPECGEILADHRHKWIVDLTQAIIDTNPQSATYRCACGAVRQGVYMPSEGSA